MIIQGTANMKDFKALIVKQGIFNHSCIENLKQSLTQDIPYHILELSIIDCKISPPLIE